MPHVSGCYDPVQLAKLRDRRCHVSEETIVEALKGTYQPEHMFALKQALSLYDGYYQHITECDQLIEQKLATIAASTPQQTEPPPFKRRGRSTKRNQPTFEIRAPLHRITGGSDLTQILGIAPLTALLLVAEIGTTVTPWPTVKHFTSWLNLAPGTKITGGKSLSGRRPVTTNRAGMLLRQAAVSVGKTASALGAFYRRIAARRGKLKALVATARKLGCIVYHLLKCGGSFVNVGLDAYEAHYRDRKLRSLRKQAKCLGFDLAPLPTEAGVT